MTIMDISLVAYCREWASQGVQWTEDSHRSFVKHMSVNHRGADVRMAEEFPHRPDILPGLQQMRRKTIPERVWGNPDSDVCLGSRPSDRAHPILPVLFILVSPAVQMLGQFIFERYRKGHPSIFISNSSSTWKYLTSHVGLGLNSATCPRFNCWLLSILCISVSHIIDILRL